MTISVENIMVFGKLIHYQLSTRNPTHKPEVLVLELPDGRKALVHGPFTWMSSHFSTIKKAYKNE